jgi:hypothetical protein
MQNLELDSYLFFGMCNEGAYKLAVDIYALVKILIF